MTEIKPCCGAMAYYIQKGFVTVSDGYHMAAIARVSGPPIDSNTISAQIPSQKAMVTTMYFCPKCGKRLNPI
jgi:hypothetical protein